ncbi:MAG: hypothetical protein KDD22_08635 [Bdellovibrionales bacterium]|nr:hypothetical protein [Bdellovibrionales bacterium]
MFKKKFEQAFVGLSITVFVLISWNANSSCLKIVTGGAAKKQSNLNGTFGTEGDHIEDYYPGVQRLENPPNLERNSLGAGIVELARQGALPSQFEPAFFERDLIKGNDQGGMLCGITCSLYMIQAVFHRYGNNENLDGIINNPEDLMELLLKVSEKFTPGDPRYGTDESTTTAVTNELLSQLGYNVESAFKTKSNFAVDSIGISDLYIEKNELLALGVMYPFGNHAQLAIAFDRDTQNLIFVDPSFKNEIYRVPVFQTENGIFMDLFGDRSEVGQIKGFQKLKLID